MHLKLKHSSILRSFFCATVLLLAACQKAEVQNLEQSATETAPSITVQRLSIVPTPGAEELSMEHSEINSAGIVDAQVAGQDLYMSGSLGAPVDGSLNPDWDLDFRAGFWAIVDGIFF